MVCLGLEPGAAGWKAQTNPLSYGGTPFCVTFCRLNLYLLRSILISVGIEQSTLDRFISRNGQTCNGQYSKVNSLITFQPHFKWDENPGPYIQESTLLTTIQHATFFLCLIFQLASGHKTRTFLVLPTCQNTLF